MNERKTFISRGFIVSCLSVLLGLIAGAILMLSIGKNPFLGYYHLIRGALKDFSRLGMTLTMASILSLTGLSLAFAGRAGLFNIGAAGQMLFGGFTASLVAWNFSFSRPVMLVLIILAAMLGGALWAAISGALKAYFNINEVVSTIMLNYIALWIVYYSIKNVYFRNTSVLTSSRIVTSDKLLRLPWLAKIFGNNQIMNLGIFIAIAAVVIIWFILEKTTFGFEVKSVGYNSHAAEYAGMNIGRGIISAMALSGALAGLAGVSYYLGYANDIQVGILPQQGYDGIAIALLGLNSPAGVGLASLLFGVLQAGKNAMTANVGISPELADSIIAIIIYFSATAALVEKFRVKIIAFFKKMFGAKSMKEENNETNL